MRGNILISYIPPEITKKGHYWRFRNKKYRTLDKAIFDWYRLQVKGGHIK